MTKPVCGKPHPNTSGQPAILCQLTAGHDEECHAVVPMPDSANVVHAFWPNTDPRTNLRRRAARLVAVAMFVALIAGIGQQWPAIPWFLLLGVTGLIVYFAAP